jgi:hypothetical protein
MFRKSLNRYFNCCALFIVLFGMQANKLFSQTSFAIKGVILDSTNAPIDGAIVSLLQAKDNSLLKTMFTEASGVFEFESTTEQNVKIKVDQLGYANYLSNDILLDSNRSNENLKIILKSANATNLKEVQVVSSVPFVQRKIDRTIVNPDALISNAGSNALDVLAKAPGVMVDQNGSIKLKGKTGVIVFIDDKPTYLTDSELESYLRSIPSSSIKQIEIMPNPPAHYEASGNSGIINIKTKRNKLQGWNGSISANYAQGRYARTSDNLNLNYSNKKIAFYSSISSTIINRYQDLKIYRRYKNTDLSTKSIFNQRTYIKIGTQSYNARLGLDYYINNKTTVGVTAKGLFNLTNISKNNTANLLDENSQLSNVVIANNNEKNEFKNGTFNLNCRHQIDTAGQQITMDLDYVAYSTGLNQVFNNFVYLADGLQIYKDRQDGSQPSAISIYAGKVDYVKPLKRNAKLDAGVKSSYTQTDNEAVYLKTINDITEVDYDLSNHFLYNEFINAAYLNFSKSYNRFDFQMGLRLESTQLSAKQLGNAKKEASKFNNDYTNLFPTTFLVYRLDSNSNNVLSFSYGRRISRAFYKDLNPFISPLDKYTYYAGNPYLKPTFAHNASLAYSFKTLFTTTFSYSNTLNQIQETIEINNGIYYSRPGNIGSSEQFNLSLEAGIPIKKWWNISIYSEVVYSEYKSKLYTETLNSKGTYWFIAATNSFVFKKGWSAEFSGEYITNFIDSQFGFGDFGHITFGFQKKLLKDKASLKFSLSDVLFTNRIRGRINNLNLTDASWTSVTDSRVASLTFSMRFGKNTNNKTKYTSSGSEAEQKRVK